MSETKSEFDDPWKTVLEAYFEQFMAFCWPERHLEIDWTKGYQCLDKELTKAMKGSKTGNKIADKLIQVFLKSGQKIRVLIHIEVQGKKESFFEERLFVYRYRLRDRYACPIATIAILIDKSKKWRPNSFYEELWGSSIRMKFPIIKMLDYKNRIEELECSTNPFAVVILAQLASLEKDKPESRLAQKWSLIKKLYRKGWKKEDVYKLLIFIDWVLVLPPELDIKCKERVDALEEELKMAYLTSFERIAKQEGKRDLLLEQLKYKFQFLSDIYLQRIQGADSESLITWSKRLLENKELEDIFEM